MVGGRIGQGWLEDCGVWGFGLGCDEGEEGRDPSPSGRGRVTRVYVAIKGRYLFSAVADPICRPYGVGVMGFYVIRIGGKVVVSDPTFVMVRSMEASLDQVTNRGIVMSKLEVPEVSGEYKVALGEYLLDLPEGDRKEFWCFLNQVSGVVQEVEIVVSLGGLGGGDLVSKYRSKNEKLPSARARFELATLKEFIRFHGVGYSASDFQHIFLQAYMAVRIEMLYGYEIGGRDQ